MSCSTLPPFLLMSGLARNARQLSSVALPSNDLVSCVVSDQSLWCTPFDLDSQLRSRVHAYLHLGKAFQAEACRCAQPRAIVEEIAKSQCHFKYLRP